MLFTKLSNIVMGNKEHCISLGQHDSLSIYMLNVMKFTYTPASILQHGYKGFTSGGTMCAQLDKFDICAKIADTQKSEINLFHVFDDLIGQNILYVTHDDQVYGLGSNRFGSLGLGHSRPVDTPTLIPELTQQGVQHFVIGGDFALALTREHQMYSWGHNYWSELGREGAPGEHNVYLKPELIAYFADKTIRSVVCGAHHSLALDSDGYVYGWGDDSCGQIGRGLVADPRAPDTLTARPTSNSSFAVTAEGGRVYSWGENYMSCLGHKGSGMEPRVVTARLISHMNSVETVCSSGCTTYFLRADGLVSFCGGYENDRGEPMRQTSPRQLGRKVHFRDLQAIAGYKKDISFVIGLKDNTVYKILDTNTVVKTGFESFYHFYANEYQLTFKTMRLNECNSAV
ncbi:unnamed protein product [Medioppia subpectinata]|uniref:Uncharacterized protein n=1 Tax=Medioppia subpectinata TaxID=1979941 RepID=A0A7R9KE71_9ACAR|nr:unnamed protein product [Medioppia subpectinata]CAG2101689.1 unnamed protein product [Medioppia subpectinata]